MKKDFLARYFLKFYILTIIGKILSTIEQFGQYPLQVNGFNNLDECLEGAMVAAEIESVHCDQTVLSGQEVSVMC